MAAPGMTIDERKAAVRQRLELQGLPPGEIFASQDLWSLCGGRMEVYNFLAYGGLPATRPESGVGPYRIAATAFLRWLGAPEDSIRAEEIQTGAWMTIQDVAVLLTWPVQTAHRWLENRLLPRAYSRGQLFFERTAILGQLQAPAAVGNHFASMRVEGGR